MAQAEAAIITLGIRRVYCHDPEIVKLSADDSSLSRGIAVGVVCKVIFPGNCIGEPVDDRQGFSL